MEVIVHDGFFLLAFVVGVDTGDVHRHVPFQVRVGSSYVFKNSCTTNGAGTRCFPSSHLCGIYISWRFARYCRRRRLPGAVWAGAGHGVCVREGFNDPLLYAAEGEAGIGAAVVFDGEDLDVGE